MSEKAEKLVDELEAACGDEVVAESSRQLTNAVERIDAARESLLAYITELEQDAARLDWLEANDGEVDRRLNGKWCVMWGYDSVVGYEDRCAIAPTPRKAIDTAIGTSVRATRDEQKEGAV